MADINIVKYTSTYLTSTIGDLAAGNHGSSYTFWINDYQNNSYLTWGGDTNYKVIDNAQGTTFSYKGLLPSYLTPDNASGSITYSTYVAYTYALFNTGLKSNYATSYFELRQHAIPKIDGTTFYSVWVGDKVTLTYSFAYTPYNTEAKWFPSMEHILTVESYTGNTGTFLANSTEDNQYGYFEGAYGYVVSQDEVGVRTLADEGNIKVHNPIKDIVLCVNNYNTTYYYHSNADSSYTSTFKALAGSNISVNCYYVAAYNAAGHSNSNTVAFNPFVSDAYIQGASFTYSCYSGTGSYTASSSSSKQVFSIDLTNKKSDTYFNLNNITYTTKVHFHTYTGVPTIAGVSEPNALYSYYTNLSISLVNLSLSLDRTTVNPGDYVTLTISTSGNDFGYVCSIDLVPSDSDTVITNFFTAPDDENVDQQINLNGGTKQLIIPSDVAGGSYRVKVTPENGKPAYKDITIKEVTLLIVDEEILTAGDGSNNGHNYVDLGLPSGTKWATCNVGADLATSNGILFQFGKTDGYAYGDTNNTFTKKDQNESITGSPYINPTTSGAEYGAGQILSLADDMARANMGGNWIMPTKADLKELFDNTTRQVLTINDKEGMLFTSKLNGKSIFVVFAGYWYYSTGQFNNSDSDGSLWSSEVHSSDADTAWCLFFNSNDYCGISSSYGRADGRYVRGVLKDTSASTATTPPPTTLPPTTTPPPTKPTTPPLTEESLTAGDGSNNGHNYVDLGLPSGTKWATCNVGGDLATSDGLLFQFGKTNGYVYGDTNNKFIKNFYYNPTTSGAKYDVGQILSLDDDMAHANMGGDWIMPTKDDLQELLDNTTTKTMTINGKKGMLFTSKLNGKSIFVVLAGCWQYNNDRFYGSGSAGCLWSSEVHSNDSGYAWLLNFDFINSCYINTNGRGYGYYVRGILKP